MCPLTLVTLASLKGQLAAEQPAARIEYYLVSVDPQRDTPERLREYVAYFDSTFHGLTGSPGALAALTQATETLFDVPEDQDADDYLVSHSSNVVLLDPARAMSTPSSRRRMTRHGSPPISQKSPRATLRRAEPAAARRCNLSRLCVD